jgi:collagen type VI alpha
MQRLVLFLAVLLLLISGLAFLPTNSAHAQVPATCQGVLDIMLTLDSSGSMSTSEFQLEKDFAISLVNSFTVSDTQVRFGAINFSDNAILSNGLSGDAAAVNAAITGMAYQGGSTDMALAINAAQAEIGARGRANSTRIILLMTDGAPNDRSGTLTAAQNALNAGTRFVSVGIGAADIGYLRNFSTEVVSASDFSALPGILNALVSATCAVGAGTVSGGCTVVIPETAVLGRMEFSQRAYWAPEKITPEVVINGGTYYVLGIDETGAWYQILLLCNRLWVPVDTMTPAYGDVNWNGRPLPTNVISVPGWPSEAVPTPTLGA